MDKILIVKNVPREGAGLIEEVLREEAVAFDIIDLDEGAVWPDVTRYRALIVLGGPDSANDDTPKMTQELQHVRTALDAKIPYLGICLGLQVLVKAGGGGVVKSPLKEVGFRDPENHVFDVALSDEGREDPLFRDIQSPFHVFQLHGETVEPTALMVVLGVGRYCRNQVVRVAPNAYGVQFHNELTPEMFEAWCTEDEDLRRLDREQLRTEYSALKDDLEKTGKQLIRNFLRLTTGSSGRL